MTEGYASGSSDGITVTSNADSAETIASVLETPDKVSEAASELGKRGGKASAEARKAESDAGDSGASSDTATDLPTSDEKPLGKPRDDPKARMLEATRKEAEAKREAKALKEENERLRREFESYRPTPPQQEQQEAPKAPGKPDPADFAQYEDYVAAVSEWAADRRFDARQAKANEEAEVARIQRGLEEAIDKDVSSFQGKIREAQVDPSAFVDELHPKLVEFLAPSWEAPLVRMQDGSVRPQLHQGHVMADEIVKLDHPVEVLRHLNANFPDFQRIATLQSAPDITRALARLDARFDGSSGAATAVTSPKPRISMATPPVRTVTGSPSVAVGEPADEASYEEHRQFYNAREQKARAQR